MWSSSRHWLVLVGAVVAIPTTARPVPAQIQVEATPGRPFGVAEITVGFPAVDSPSPVASSLFTVTSTDGRVLYPAFNQGFVTRLLGSQAVTPRRLNVMFLFVGDDPFDVVIRTPTAQRVRVVPQRRAPAAHTRLVRRWWRYYTEFLRQQGSGGTHPSVIETYLSATLTRRLDLDQPLLQRLRADSPPPSENRQALELITGAERMRREMLRSSSLGIDLDMEPARMPLPAPVPWQPLQVTEPTQEVPVEPLALRVPPECFYVRFGQFVNYLWLQSLLEDYGGELGSMISARGQRTNTSERIGDQLVLKQTVLAELLGPQVIADMAVIGMDTLAREGAAIGVIFEARNQLLELDLTRQRQEALFRERERGATLSTVPIAGRDVSFLCTPDNRLRSFYLVDSPYHLVTNSRAMVERFLAVRDGRGSLGARAEFRQTRAAVPTARDDTIFVYMSSTFFEHLFSPAYQIELHRRLRAATEIQQITLARLAAQREGQPGDTIEQLIAAQVLPSGFGQRPDGSTPVVVDGVTVDSLRGAPGFFTPVPDIGIDLVTEREASRYGSQREHYAQHWQQMDPLLITIRRTALDVPGQERVTLEAFVSPLAEGKYHRFLSSLGEPSAYQLVPPADNLISVEASLRGGLLFPRIPPHTLFFGVQDHVPLSTPSPETILRWLPIVRTTPGYLGAWPEPGFLDLLPLGLAGTPDQAGFSALPLGVWRWQGRGFSAISLDRSILEDVSAQVGFVEVENPAQIRVRIGDLSQAKFRAWLNAVGYERARQVSVSNARLLHLLIQQLGVPPEQALEVATRLLDSELVCPLRGQYELQQAGDASLWRSTAWPGGLRYEVPADYTTPPLDWLRRLEAEVTRHPSRLVARVSVDMQRRDRPPRLNLPQLDLLRKSLP